jgi:hypothetical protein
MRPLAAFPCRRCIPYPRTKTAALSRLRERGSLMPLASSTASVKHQPIAQASAMRSNGENTLAA